MPVSLVYFFSHFSSRPKLWQGQGVVPVLCGVKMDYNLLDPFYVCLAMKIHKTLGMVG